MLIKDLEEFIGEKGDLHDCRINGFLWSETNRLEISIFDINANFDGLPEYPGPQPGLMVFDGIHSVEVDGITAKGGLKVYEVKCGAREDQIIFEFMFSPSGRIAVCADNVSLNVEGRWLGCQAQQ
jgi:hypothetical protein